MRDGLPEGRIVLPLDEIVRRLPPEMLCGLHARRRRAGHRALPAALPARPARPGHAGRDSRSASDSGARRARARGGSAAAGDAGRPVDRGRHPAAGPGGDGSRAAPDLARGDCAAGRGAAARGFRPGRVHPTLPGRRPRDRVRARRPAGFHQHASLLDMAPAEAPTAAVPALATPPLPAAPVEAPPIERARREAPPVQAPRFEMPPAEPVARPAPVSRSRHERSHAAGGPARRRPHALRRPRGELDRHRGRDAVHLRLRRAPGRGGAADRRLHPAVPHERSRAVGGRPAHGAPRGRRHHHHAARLRRVGRPRDGRLGGAGRLAGAARDRLSEGRAGASADLSGDGRPPRAGRARCAPGAVRDPQCRRSLSRFPRRRP